MNILWQIALGQAVTLKPQNSDDGWTSSFRCL